MGCIQLTWGKIPWKAPDLKQAENDWDSSKWTKSKLCMPDKYLWDQQHMESKNLPLIFNCYRIEWNGSFLSLFIVFFDVARDSDNRYRSVMDQTRGKIDNVTPTTYTHSFNFIDFTQTSRCQSKSQNLNSVKSKDKTYPQTSSPALIF